MNGKKIRYTIIGYGHIGKRHASVIYNNEDSVLTAIVDTDESKKNEINQRYNQTHFYNHIDAFFKDDTLTDVVVIAVPNYLHAPYALQSMEKGYHVVIEKPLCIYMSEAQKLLDHEKLYNKKVFCVMQNRYSPPSVWLKKIIQENILGKLYMVQMTCLWNRDQRYYTPGHWHGKTEMDGGSLYTQFSHFIDLLYWCFGEIEILNCQLYNYNHSLLTQFEDSGMVQFKINSGGTGSFLFSTSVYDKNMESSMTLIGENGSVKVGGQYMDQVNYCHIRNYNFPELESTSAANDYGHYKGSAANHHFIIENVNDVLLRGAAIHTPLHEGVAVVDIITRIYQMGRNN